ncbi:MAG: hypothetical protein KGI54_14310 [Pseudomonadota bacterium]|nr:hypothetical protein [Pseudomonadota bacterium]
MSIIILMLLGAFLWRLRGGILNSLTGKVNWLGFNDTAVRLIWSVGMSGAFWLLHPSAHWIGEGWLLAHGIPAWCGVILLVAALFAGTTVVGWFGAALLPTRLRDVALLSLSGILRMGPVALVLLSPLLLLAGLLFGPAYWLGARISQRPGGWDFWGEWITGAVIGACLGAI